MADHVEEVSSKDRRRANTWEELICSRQDPTENCLSSLLPTFFFYFDEEEKSETEGALRR